MLETLETRYRLLEKIGAGGTAEVFLAESLSLGNRWAVKILDEKNNDSNNQVQEVEILKNLNHPMLPRIVDVLQSDNRLCIVMDYIQGDNLLDFLARNGHFKESNVIEWAFQLCDVLIYLHNCNSQPIIYRDLKPANLLLDTQGNLKLIDFGTARMFSDQKVEDTAYLGTQGYACPEQFGFGQSDEKADIYSLGMTLFHLLTGKHPNQIVHSKISYCLKETGVSSKFTAIILRCIRILPAERYASVENLLEELKTLQQSVYRLPRLKIGRVDKKAPKPISMSIAIMNACPGAGSTFACLSLATFFSSYKQTTAIMEMNGSGDLERLEKRLVSTGGISSNDDRFYRYRKTDFYKSVKKITDHHPSRYDIMLLDFGSQYT